MTKAEEFARLNGIEWRHTLSEEWSADGKSCDVYDLNPTFTDAKSILEVMMKREDWINFIGGFEHIPVDYILNPDRLLDEAIKFCKEAE